MMNYKLTPNLGICPKCKDSNVWLTHQPVCSGCQHAWANEEVFINEQTRMIRFRLQTSKKSMTKQKTVVTYGNAGTILKIKGGIEWTVKLLPGQKYRPGYTCNPVGGCFHDCEWIMPDGKRIECYAKTVAERLAVAAYPKGFRAIYWHPERLYDGLKVPESVRIFFDSMSDMFQIGLSKGRVYCFLRAVEDMAKHDILILTKNPARVPQFEGYLPQNLWAGFSSPPDFFMGKQLSRDQQERMLHKAFKSFARLNLKVRWASFEPLSWDIAPIVAQYPGVINWAVIGAASDGPELFQPNRRDLDNLIDVLDRQGVKIFQKGNLDYAPGRYEFPEGS